MHSRIAGVVSLVAVLVVFAPAPAEADCWTADCICGRGAYDAAIVVRALGTGDGGSAPEGVVEQATPRAGVSVGDTVAVPTGSQVTPDSRWYVPRYLDESTDEAAAPTWGRAVPIRDGRVSCSGRFGIDLDAALEAIAANECVARVDAAGFTEPPCNDVVFFPFGCASGGSAFVGVVLAWVLRTRRRSRR